MAEGADREVARRAQPQGPSHGRDTRSTLSREPDLRHEVRTQSPRGDLDRIYENRFRPTDIESKDRVWREITRWLQPRIDAGAPVLDVATDRGYFIRNIMAVERWATDIRDVREHLGADVKFVQVPGTAMAEVLPPDHFGTIFMSNYLEHLADHEVVIEQLRQAHVVCAPGGQLVILQPNIRLVGNAYWDFLDHRTALTGRSLVEACELAGFKTKRVITRFLPFTTKSWVPRATWLVYLYLRFPPARWLLGKQTLYLGERSPSAER